MTTPAVQRLGDAIVLQGAALAEVRHLLAIGVRERERRNAVAPSLALRNMLALISEALAEADLMSPPRHGDVAENPGQQEWINGDELDECSSEQAAQILGLGRRQVQRLACSLGARKALGGALVFQVGAVRAYAAERNEKERNG